MHKNKLTKTIQRKLQCYLAPNRIYNNTVPEKKHDFVQTEKSGWHQRKTDINKAAVQKEQDNFAPTICPMQDS